MAYIEDLVQEIYTNCHTEGIDKLNQGLQDAIWYLADLNKISQQNHNFQTQALNLQNQSFISKKQQIKLDELQANARLRYREKEENYQRRKEKADNREISNMKKKNALQGFLVRTIGAFFTINTLKNIVNTGSELQLIQKSIEGLTGSAQDWQFLNQQAYKFGLNLKTVSSGYKNFYSSANMAGVGKGQIQQMYSDLLLGARSIGASDQQIGGALLALEQVYSKGRVSMEELRRQLGNALPGAFEIGAKAMGVTTQKFNEMVKAGISAQEFVPKFIKTFKEQYEKGWADVEQTVAVAQGRLKVAGEQFTMEILHGEAGKALAEGLTQIAEFMRSPETKVLIITLGRIFVGVNRIISFTLQHLPLILTLLGMAGLTKLLLTNISLLGGTTTLWGLLNAEIGVSTLAIGVWGEQAVTSFMAANKAALTVYGTLLSWLVVLGYIEDILTYVLSLFGLTDRKSMIGEASKNPYTLQSWEGTTKSDVPMFWRKRPQELNREIDYVKQSWGNEFYKGLPYGLTQTPKYIKELSTLYNLQKELKQDVNINQNNTFVGNPTQQNQLNYENATNFLMNAVLKRLGVNQ